MKKLLILISILLLAFPACSWAWGTVVISGGVPTTTGCSTNCDSAVYDIRDGDNESFENEFCTANMAEADADGVISFSSSDSHSGSYALSVVADSDNTGVNQVSATLASGDGSLWFGFFIKCPSVATWSQYYFFKAVDSSWNTYLKFRLRNEDTGAVKFHLYNATDYSSNYFALTAGNWYYISVVFDGSGNVDCKVYDVSSSSWMTNDGGSNNNITVAAGSSDLLVLYFWDDYDNTTAITALFDDFQIDIDGSTHPTTPCGGIMIKRVIANILLFLFLMCSSALADITCGTTISSSGTYTLTANKTCSGTWITISADDVVIDGANYIVTYGDSSSASGIVVNDGYSGLEIKNLTLTQGASGGNGVYALNADMTSFDIHDNTFNMNQSVNFSAIKSSYGNYDDLKIHNNIFNLNPNTSGQIWGIYIEGDTNHNIDIYSNTFTLGTNVGVDRPAAARFGISGTSTITPTFRGNTITIEGSMAYAWLGWGSDYWDISNNEITISSTANNSKGIQLDGGSDYNVVRDNIITINANNTSSASYGVRIRFGSDHNEVFRNKIDASGSSGSYASYCVSVGADQTTDPTDPPSDNEVYSNMLTGSGANIPIQLYEDNLNNYFYCNSLSNGSGYGVTTYGGGTLEGVKFDKNKYTITNDYAVHIIFSASATITGMVFCEEKINGTDMESSDVYDPNNVGGWAVTTGGCFFNCNRTSLFSGNAIIY